MRHRVDHKKLNRTSSHRRAMLRNMVTSLFEKERITTTDAKAKEARRFAERLITRAKKGYGAYQEVQHLKDEGKEAEASQMQAVALAHWRHAARFVQNKAILKKLFNDLAPLYMERYGGYTRILRLGKRLGDNAMTVMLELVGTEITSQPKVRKPHKKKEEEAPESAAPAEEMPAKEADISEEAEESGTGASEKQTASSSEEKSKDATGSEGKAEKAEPASKKPGKGKKSSSDKA